MAKLITVFGATGAQGGSVARALLAAGGYKVRAVTRNNESPKAKALGEQGCEVVKTDMDSKESLEQAISGSYGVFAVTNYWGLFGENQDTAKDREIQQGKNIGDICKDKGVKHLVYSGLEDVKSLIGKDCPHFDAKGIVEKYLDANNIPNTSTRASFYYENFVNFAPPQKNDDGTYTMTWPMEGPMDAVRVEDMGAAVVSIFNNPNEYIGKKVGLSGDRLTMNEYAAIISEVTGKTLTYNQVPANVYAKFPFPGAEDLAAMFEFYATSEFVREIPLTRKLNPATQTFRQWAESNKDTLLA